MTEMQYTSKDIQTNQKLDYVRLRPTGFINDTGQAGQVHIAKEIVDNVSDEMELLGAAGIMNIVVFHDHGRGTYQILVCDNGRGVPLEEDKMLDVFTKLNTSGKFDDSSYKFSTGSFGVGAKATAALSKHFRALTMRPSGVGDVIVHDGIEPDNLIRYDKVYPQTGTYVIFEPDKKIFAGVNKFMEEGFHDLMALLKLFNLFSNYRIRVGLYPTGVDTNIWKMAGPLAIDQFNEYIQTSSTIFDNTVDDTDPDMYVREYFNIVRPFAWKHQVVKPVSNGDPIAYDIRAFAIKYENVGGHLSMVNSVPMKDNDCSHLTQFNMVLKRLMAPYIDGKEVREFFMKTYKLPIFVCMSVKWNGAQFIGKQKTGFKDPKFTNVYGKLLTEYFGSNGNMKLLKELFDIYAEDIEAKYIAYTSGTTQVKDNKKLFLSLNFPSRFVDCSTKERDTAELFLTEGDSANSTEGRNPKIQASYSLCGKPLNPITSQDNLKDTIVKLQNNKIYQDILMITGLTPHQTDFSSLKYGKIFLMTDADTHGKHIVNIVVSNLYAINPKFIESGILHIVTPPFYGLRIKNKKYKDTGIIYIRNADELVNALAMNVYYPSVEVAVFAADVFDKPKVLNKQEFVEFARIVCHVGGLIERLAEQHVINPLILEQLTHVTHYLTPETMDINVLKQTLGNDSISYDAKNNILMMSIGRRDLTISLHALRDTLYQEVLPFLNKIAWRNWGVLVSTKHTDMYKDTPMSLVQLYNIFKSLDTLFTIKRWKGLGSMMPLDRALTCMNQQYRSTYKITTIGDVDRVFDLMGNDSAARKALVL